MQRPALADYPAGARMADRVLDDYELVWMVRGQAEVAADDEPFMLRPGSVLLMPPGFRHGIAWDQARPCRHGYVHFSADNPGRAMPARPLLRPMGRTDPLAGLCAYLLWLGSSRQDGWKAPALHALDVLLQLIVTGPLPDTEPPVPLPPALHAALARLRQMWSQDPRRRVGVAELCAASGVSRGYLNRLFRAHFSLSVAQAIERLRCARAETLLSRTDLTAETIARQCGYADVSHFSHRFTALHGMPPTAYRRQAGHAPSVLDHSGVRHLGRLL